MADVAKSQGVWHGPQTAWHATLACAPPCGQVTSKGKVQGFPISIHLNEHPARVLCDTGATHTFVSASFVVAHAVPVHMVEHMQEWHAANTVVLSCSLYAKVELRLSSAVVTCQLNVMPPHLPDFDVLLGVMARLRVSLTIRVRLPRVPFQTWAQLLCESVARLALRWTFSKWTCCSRYKIKGSGYAVTLRDDCFDEHEAVMSYQDKTLSLACDKSVSKALNDLLHEYADVFSPVTSQPPKRSVGHAIPRVLDARPSVTFKQVTIKSGSPLRMCPRRP
ncbi:retroviral aspartyl protease [Haematococcus lacustris]|uniref:Retroviral aspartyl protease n=1 Tax=Haematococcus lacustris TaxID=44745 RepID=A0A699ZAC2_HAELA|nr:retroviral aspartyl protease [Haematococcus lacustris]